MMFDLQTMRYCSPMLDLTTLLANSCTFELREKHSEEILRAYHLAVTDVLAEKLSNGVPEHYRYLIQVLSFLGVIV